MTQHLNALPKCPLYHTDRWRKIKAEMIQVHPFCRRCGRTRALNVHHTIQHGGNPDIFFNPLYLEVICDDCHKVINAAQARAARKGD